MIIHQPLRRIYRGSELVWIEDGPAQEMTPEQLYQHWMPNIASFVYVAIDNDGVGVVKTNICSYLRAEIITDDIDSVRVVNQKWREEFIHRDHQYKHSFTGSAP